MVRDNPMAEWDKGRKAWKAWDEERRKAEEAERQFARSWKGRLMTAAVFGVFFSVCVVFVVGGCTCCVWAWRYVFGG